jgi:hypothetical protein
LKLQAVIKTLCNQMYDTKRCFQFKQYCIVRDYICYTRICCFLSVPLIYICKLTRHFNNILILLNYSNTCIKQEAIFHKLLSKGTLGMYNEIFNTEVKVLLKCNHHQTRISVGWEHETLVLFRVKVTDYFDLLHKHLYIL